MSRPVGRRDRNPQTGQALSRARESLFILVVVTVGLGALLNALVGHLASEARYSASWWAWLLGLSAAALALVFLGAWWDDHRVGQAEVEIELALTYLESGDRRRVALAGRRSYAVADEARQAWSSRYPHGLALAKREGAFQHIILPEHLALVRHLLAAYIARHGRRMLPKGMDYKILRRNVPLESQDWADLEPLVRDNPFSQVRGAARPQSLRLPPGTRIEARDLGPLLLRLTWVPGRGRWRWLLQRLPLAPWGALSVHWQGPLTCAVPADRIYEHMTTRIGDDAQPPAKAHVVLTQMTVEVRSRWNALASVARFRDWALNLATYLERELDYWGWRAYYLERNIDDLDWKLGYLSKGEEPSLIARVKRLDERLARLEEHLWPDEPASGEEAGAWLSGDDDAGERPDATITGGEGSI